MVALTPRVDELNWFLQRPAQRANDAYRVSLYMPVQRLGRRIRQDFIRYKNLLNEAEDQLIDRGMRPPDARDRLHAARALGEDGNFWLHRDAALAVFIDVTTDDSADHMRHYDLPYTVREQVHVNQQFALRPLLPRYCLPRTEDRHFFVLVLNLNEVELFESDGETLKVVHLPSGLPALKDLQAYIDTEKSLQFHSGAAGTIPGAPGASRIGIFHGHGADDARENKRALELLHMLDDALRPVLVHSGQRAPLIPVGVDWVVNQFREICSYPYITPQHIPGSIRHRTPHELHEQAKQIADDVFKDEARAAIDQYLQQQGTPGASADVAHITSLAMMGQVHSLLVVLDEQLGPWGKADAITFEVTVHPQRQPGDQDLLELAILHTLQHNGEVTVIPRDRMPEPSPIAAVLRRGAAAMRHTPTPS